MAIYANLSVDQGSTFKTTIEVSEAGSGTETNLTNYTVRAQIRKSYSSTTAVDFDAAIDDEENGIVSITLQPAASGALRAGRYVYDVEIESENGAVTRVLEGQLEVTPRVTRPTV